MHFLKSLDKLFWFGLVLFGLVSVNKCFKVDCVLWSVLGDKRWHVLSLPHWTSESYCQMFTAEKFTTMGSFAPCELPSVGCGSGFAHLVWWFANIYLVTLLNLELYPVWLCSLYTNIFRKWFSYWGDSLISNLGNVSPFQRSSTASESVHGHLPWSNKPKGGFPTLTGRQSGHCADMNLLTWWQCAVQLAYVTNSNHTPTHCFPTGSTNGALQLPTSRWNLEIAWN